MEHLYIAIWQTCKRFLQCWHFEYSCHLSIIERVSIKRLTEDLLLIIDGCRNTWSINKQFSKYMQEVCVYNTSDSKLITCVHILNYLTQ